VNEPVDDIDCQDLVELVTDYLEETLAPHERARIDRHLAICTGCATVLAQWRTVIDMVAQLTERDVQNVSPEVRTRLMNAFRNPDSP
jgi:anti-sigma factor RsiW